MLYQILNVDTSILTHPRPLKNDEIGSRYGEALYSLGGSGRRRVRGVKLD